MNGNAFLRRQGAMFIPCGGCTTSQECGCHGQCCRDLFQQYMGQKGRNSPHNSLSAMPGWQILIANTQRTGIPFSSQEADSDGGECD